MLSTAKEAAETFLSDEADRVDEVELLSYPLYRDRELDHPDGQGDSTLDNAANFKRGAVLAASGDKVPHRRADSFEVVVGMVGEDPHRGSGGACLSKVADSEGHRFTIHFESGSFQSRFQRLPFSRGVCLNDKKGQAALLDVGCELPGFVGQKCSQFPEKWRLLVSNPGGDKDGAPGRN